MSAVLAVPQDIRNRVHDLIYESCLLLNEERWDDFLDLCDSETFRYVIGNYSPEIGKEQFWLDIDFAGMKHMFEMLPKHNTDHAQLTRQSTVYRLEYAPENEVITATTGFTIYRTHEDGGYAHLDGGSTCLYVVGQYIDRVALRPDGDKLTQRTVWTNTRQLDIGSHYPF